MQNIQIMMRREAKTNMKKAIIYAAFRVSQLLNTIYG